MGKTIVITGATDGIGKEIAKQLAVEGHHIVIHGRSDEKCIRTKKEIQALVPNANLDIVSADFSALSNVQKMAETISERYPRLDVLINNAGVYNTSNSFSQDGFELNLAVNYLASCSLLI